MFSFPMLEGVAAMRGCRYSARYFMYYQNLLLFGKSHVGSLVCIFV